MPAKGKMVNEGKNFIYYSACNGFCKESRKGLFTCVLRGRWEAGPRPAVGGPPLCCPRERRNVTNGWGWQGH